MTLSNYIILTENSFSCQLPQQFKNLKEKIDRNKIFASL